MHIEQSFGILMARLGILWKPLRYSLSQNSRIVQLTMCLHNRCIDNSDAIARDLMSEIEYISIEKYCRELMNSSDGGCRPSSLTGRRTSQARSVMRDSLLRIIEEQGHRRPSFN